jgi:NADP-dependent 3-hydroxy acid dehydrogenase YdfG
MERYQGKKVVIIGGTSGMGLATAKMLLDGDARVLVTGRSQAGLESAQKELGKDAIMVSSDLRSLTEIERSRHSSEDRVRDHRPALRQCRIQHPSPS